MVEQYNKEFKNQTQKLLLIVCIDSFGGSFKSHLYISFISGYLFFTQSVEKEVTLVSIS